MAQEIHEYKHQQEVNQEAKRNNCQNIKAHGKEEVSKKHYGTKM
ncbi:MAG: hypothetical protein ACLTXR_04640 [Clostridia bacterium]